MLSRQRRASHQERIDRPHALTPFANRPYDKALAAPHVGGNRVQNAPAGRCGIVRHACLFAFVPSAIAAWEKRRIDVARFVAYVTAAAQNSLGEQAQRRDEFDETGVAHFVARNILV
jgi:hypothetical protein